jgi:hypothetical protein
VIKKLFPGKKKKLSKGKKSSWEKNEQKKNKILTKYTNPCGTVSSHP